MNDIVAVITSDPLDPTTVDRAVSGPEHGAVVTMSGVVRNHDHDRAVSALEYQAHPDAERFLLSCCESISSEFGLPVAAMHRVGPLVVGDLALVASVAAPHRGDAFAACSALVDRIKVEVPIWKRQQFPEGTSEWVGL
ncbi:molybdenum cofactor biosynthesis protein MoaE [Actinomycetes bacterium M1A6_2h]